MFLYYKDFVFPSVKERGREREREREREIERTLFTYDSLVFPCDTLPLHIVEHVKLFDCD